MKTRIQPIAITDVVRYLVEFAARPSPRTEKFDVGGPEIVTYLDLLRMIDTLLSTRRKFIEVPGKLSYVASWGVSLLSGINGQEARVLFESVACELVCQENRIQEVFPGKMHSLRDSLAVSPEA